MSKKAVVTPHLSGRVHLRCDIFSCLVLHGAPKRNPSYSLSSPQLHVFISLWSQGQMANSLVIISLSRLEVQIRTYTNIEKSRFLLTPNLRMLDFFWHLPPTTPPAHPQFSHSFEATSHPRLSRARAPEPRGGSAAGPGRRRRWPPGGCRCCGGLQDLGLPRGGCGGLGLRLRSRFREAPEAEGKKFRQKNDIRKKDQKLANLGFWTTSWPFCLANCERSIQIQWQYTVCSCGLLFWCHLWCAKCTFGMWRRCMYQTWGKK